MISKKPYYKQEMSPALEFITFVGVTLGLLVLGNAIGMGYVIGRYGLDAFKALAEMDVNSPLVIKNLWFLQIVGTTLPILLTPVVFGWLIMKQPKAYLRTNTNFPVILLLIVFVVMFASTPIMELSVTINRKLSLPGFLKGVEEWMRSAEKSAQKATAAMLKMDTIADMLKSLLLIGLTTAIAEELMFRGSLQTIFLKWTKNTHAAVWITAALFSAFHMQFFGFLPRLALGVFFGYFTVWSGSVWPAIWAHFINNGTAVIFTYLHQHKQITIDPEGEHTFNYSLYFLSFIFTVALLWSYRKAALKKNDYPQY